MNFTPKHYSTASAYSVSRGRTASDLPTNLPFKEPIAIKEFKEKWNLTYVEVAYCLGIPQDNKSGLASPSVHTIFNWVKGVSQPLPSTCVLVDVIDEDWKRWLKKNVQENKEVKLSYKRPWHWVFAAKILPSYKEGSLCLKRIFN